MGSARPANVVDRDDAVRVLAELFPDEDRAKIRAMVHRSGVERRHIVPTLEEVLAPSDFTARNAAYGPAAVELSVDACRAALDSAELDPDAIDVLIDVSCTGVTIPAADVSLVPRLGLRPDVRRIPITAAGCAGGALGLALAADLARLGRTVLVLAVEVCTLSHVPEDRTRTNLVASVLFGDGAAAAIVTPGGERSRGPRIEATRSHLLPATSEVMGFEVGSHGLRIVLDRRLPGIVAEHLPAAIEEFLGMHGRSSGDLAQHLVHPGGIRILEAYEERFGLTPHDLRHSRSVLAERGNLSSATILEVLGRAMTDPPADGGDAVLVAIGPGLSFEMVLLGWDGRP